MRKIIIVLLNVLLFVSLFSCADNGLDEVSSRITWSSGEARSLLIKSPDLTATAKSLGDSAVTEYYSDYGELIGTITPTKFKIPLQAVNLCNADGSVNPIPFHQFDEENQIWIMQYADFTSNVVTDPGEILKEEYTDFLLFFFSDVGSMGMSSTPDVNAVYGNEVVLDLPNEYAGKYPIVDSIAQYWNWTESENEDLMLDGEPIYETKILDADEAVFQVCLESLMPGQKMVDGYLQRRNMEIFWFNGDEYITYDVPEGQDTHKLSDYKTTPGMDINGDGIFTRLPWNGLVISQDAEKVEFELDWDLTDIIEIYDNNTEDHSDDILVLMDKYWERIQINVTQYDSSGVSIE